MAGDIASRPHCTDRSDRTILILEIKMRRLSKLYIVISIIWLLMLVFPNQGFSNGTQEMTVMKNLTSMPLAFTENQGQWDEKVLFRANTGGATMWSTDWCMLKKSLRGAKALGLSDVAISKMFVDMAMR